MIHAPIPAVKQADGYAFAKAGDADAAADLVAATLSDAAVAALVALVAGSDVVLSPVHALESTGVNAIPLALAERIGAHTGWDVETTVVQTNLVGHTGATGFGRLARQAHFEGAVVAGRAYVMVDDFVGQGGTMANLRGHMLSEGAEVLAATTLTGKAHSARLQLQQATLEELRRKHGQELEEWWRKRFGHGFDCLTESEARYLVRTPDAQRVRDRIASEEQS